MKSVNTIIENVYHELSAELKITKKDLKLLTHSNRSTVLTLNYLAKIWLVKYYKTRKDERKAKKELFFFTNIYPILYSESVEILLFRLTKNKDNYLIIREYFNLFSISKLSKQGVLEIIYSLKNIHSNEFIKNTLLEKYGPKRDFYGEISGRTEGIENSKDPRVYFRNATNYWEQNIFKDEKAQNHKGLFLKVKQIMFDGLDSFDSKPSFVHGDINISNIMKDIKGKLIILDFENFFSFYKEYDFVSIFFQRQMSRQQYSIELSKDNIIELLIKHYYNESISHKTLKKRIECMSCYASLRLWNYSKRINDGQLSIKIIQNIELEMKTTANNV
jgi:thiamine kinase-like enzyme